MKVGCPCRGLNTGSSFIAHDEAMYVSPVETVEKALGTTISGQVSHIPSQFMRNTDFNASKDDDA